MSHPDANAQTMCFLESKYLDEETVCHNDELECPFASDDPCFHPLKTLRTPDRISFGPKMG
jgi:hypothetical protein